MDHMKQMNEAMDYIEDHLTGDVDICEAARYAHCSEYHFRRIFSYLAGVPISEYIRKRRLTLAAMDLVDHEEKVLEVALKYGYHSPDSFTRAFQTLLGYTPSEARKMKPSLAVYPPLIFQMTVQGGEPMNYRITEQDAFRIAGIEKRVSIQFEGVNPEIAAMWENLDEEKIKRMTDLSDTEPEGLISASVNFSEGRMEEKGGLDHYIGVATTKSDIPDDLDVLEVKSCTWAVFTVEGPFPETLQRTWGRIYSEWFPQSAYEQTEGPEILWNEKKNTSAEDFRSEIWIPVKKRE